MYNFYLKEERTADGVDSPATPPGNATDDQAWRRFGDAPMPALRSPSRSRSRDHVCAVEDAPQGIFEDPPEDESGRGVAEGVEARPANPGWTPVSPTPAERAEHEASGHAVYRSWCEECLAATGRSQQHRRVDHSGDLVDTVVMDYFYLGEAEGSKPHLVAQDRRTGMMLATALEKKGVNDGAAQKILTKHLELLGYREVVLKSDGERALVSLKTLAARNAKCVARAINEESPVGDSKANGEAEAAVKEVKWRIRAIIMTLEKKLNTKIPEGHPLLTWIPRYAAEQSNRFKVGHDGRTPEERRTGKKWIRPMPLFGERIMIKPVGKGRRGDLKKMKPARFLGCHNRYGSVLGMTEDGVVVGSSYHSLAEEDKWLPLEAGLRGSPWDVNDYIKQMQEVGEQIPAQLPVVLQPALLAPSGEPVRDGAQEGEEAVDKGPLIGAPSASGQKPSGGRLRAFPVRREHLATFGKTREWPGCESITKGLGFQQIAHNEDCRVRIKRCLEEKNQAELEKIKKQREEDQAIEFKMKPAEERLAEASGSSSSAVGAAPAVAEAPMEESVTSPKRKGGEGGAQDIEDLSREVEAELDSSLREESLKAMEAVIGSYEAAKIIADIGAMDVVEVFSPARINQEVERFGLRRGVAIDLEEMKPDGSRHWDLDLDEDYQEALNLIVMEQPLLLTSSPPCTTFCPLRRLWNGKRDPLVVQAEEEQGRERVRRAIQCCKTQASIGGFFLHEHPRDSSSWKMPEVEELVNRDDTFLVQSPMCRFNMKMLDDDGNEAYVRKETLWLTNCRAMAEELEGTCENKLKGKEIHRHVRVIGGRAHAAQVYPVELVEAILRGLKLEMKRNHKLSAVEEMFSGPSPDDAVEWDHEMDNFMDELYMDDASGAILDPKLVKQGRAEELEWLRREKVYERVPLREAEGHGPLLKVKWLDINKGDALRPKVRCRLVAKEIKRAKPKELQLGGADTFSSTPPVESMFSLLSLFMTKKDAKADKLLGTWDISRAHFMGKAEREIYMTLPEEDEVQEGDTEPMVGKVLRSIYGTQDASKIFQLDYQSWLGKNGATFCALCPSLFKVEDKGLLGLVHGDDFMVTGNKESLKWFDKVLNERYTARWEALLGEAAEKNETFFLNRLLRYVPDGTDDGGCRLEVEADARHADIIIRAFNLQDGGKGCDVPEEKVTEKDLIDAERQSPLEPGQVSQFRSLVMRLAYMSVDRPDLCHVVRTLASAMKTPRLSDWMRLKKVARYLVKVPYMKRVYKMQNPETLHVNVMTDSDWAGDLRTRRSTSGAVIRIGAHVVQIKCASQKVVALSSMESEYYSMCRGVTEAMFIRSVVDFWGICPGTMVLRVDSSSAKALAERKGVGKSRHIQARYLWLQDLVFSKELNVQKTPGRTNDPDLVTKVQPRATMKDHLTRMNFHPCGREGHKGLT